MIIRDSTNLNGYLALALVFGWTLFVMMCRLVAASLKKRGTLAEMQDNFSMPSKYKLHLMTKPHWQPPSPFMSCLRGNGKPADELGHLVLAFPLVFVLVLVLHFFLFHLLHYLHLHLLLLALTFP